MLFRLGLGKRSMEAKIIEEIEYLCDEIDARKGKPFNCQVDHNWLVLVKWLLEFACASYGLTVMRDKWIYLHSRGTSGLRLYEVLLLNGVTVAHRRWYWSWLFLMRMTPAQRYNFFTGTLYGFNLVVINRITSHWLGRHNIVHYSPKRIGSPKCSKLVLICHLHRRPDIDWLSFQFKCNGHFATSRDEFWHLYKLQSVLASSVSNVICNVILGSRYSYDDDDFRGMLRVINQQWVNS